MTTAETPRRRGMGLAGVLAAATLVAFAAQGVVVAQTATVAPTKKTDKADRKAGSKKQRGKKQAARGTQKVTSDAAGQLVSVDPASGRLIQPNPEESQKLAEGMTHLLSQSTEGLLEIQLPNGAIAVDLQDRFNEISIATVGPDGKVTTTCVKDHASAEAILLGKAPAKPAPGQALEEK